MPGLISMAAMYDDNLEEDIIDGGKSVSVHVFYGMKGGAVLSVSVCVCVCVSLLS